MITEKDTEHIAQLADIAIYREELAAFTSRFNEILEYFDILDTVEVMEDRNEKECNVLRDDEIVPSLPQERALANVKEQEEGFFKAPRVM
ncbi:MAG: Asp-tRNA(Asn)/Glu-tRNA(Gln) amidotransferase subunit GatC [Methanolinea sp.]|jgi:aspartyl-tRNA(Asn)/glutamyl-tRNA(Gln) amidotransferase subunit C|nr:Asp-tRNA(Asn)/Glu-tRNA(Gln) amidotransferase subunit GatC [Methanolinea sp.]